jgi:ribosomal protein S18 acetylase RimI-like enzyme
MEQIREPKVSLHRATEADIQTYLDIEKKLASKTYATYDTKEEVLEALHSGVIYIIKNAELPVGITSYEMRDDGSAYISSLAIDPEYQGQGFARKAMEQLLAELAHVPLVWLVTHPDNVKALQLYESLGFAITGRKENYFGDGEPRVEMELVRE